MSKWFVQVEGNHPLIAMCECASFDDGRRLCEALSHSAFVTSAEVIDMGGQVVFSTRGDAGAYTDVPLREGIYRDRGARPPLLLAPTTVSSAAEARKYLARLAREGYGVARPHAEPSSF